MKEICRTVISAPSFIIVNGEAGGGKTTIAEALFNSGVDSQQTYHRSLFKSSPNSSVTDVRKYLIAQLYGSDIFDPDDMLSDTAQMFEVTRPKQLVIIDNIDYFDKGFLNELYQFYENYCQPYTMSVVITTGHLLTDLIDYNGGNPPRYKEFTIRQLSEGEQTLLLTNCVKRFSSGVQLDQNVATNLLKETEHQPAQIVKFAENYVMDNLNRTPGSDNANSNDEPQKFSSTVIENDDVPQVIKHSIKKPTGPNKFLVVGIAVVLTVALVGVIVMLLKKQDDTTHSEEVVVASQSTNTNSPETVVQTPTLNDQDQIGAEQQMVDNMMKGIDDGSLVTTVDIDDLPPLENTQPVDIASNVDNVDVVNQPEEIKSAEHNEVPVNNEVVVDKTVVEPVKPVEPAQPSSEKVVVVDNTAKEAPAVKPSQEKKEPAEKPASSKKENNKVAQDQNQKKNEVTVKPAQEKVVNNKPTVEVGVVYPFDGSKKPAAKSANVSTNIEAKSSGNYLVQVACNSNINSLQAMKNKLGSNAFIYERKNNSLKYVLVVGYFSTQQEARAVATKIGHGAWVKSAAAMRNEKK